MNIRKITKADKEQIYKLFVEEDKILQKFASFKIYKVKFNKKLLQ